MKCNDAGPACQGKSYPSKHIPIPTQVSNIIFQNNLTIVHNYANEEIKYDKKIFEKDEITIFESQVLNELLIIGLSKTHYDMAKLLYHLYREDYIFLSGNNGGLWYEFFDHRWHRKTPSLKQKISEDLQEYYEKLKNYYEVGTNLPMGDKDKENKLKIIENLINKLKDAPYKKNVMSEAADFFEMETFREDADDNRNLLCFNNGVYDFTKMEFRKGLRSRPYNYVLIVNLLNIMKKTLYLKI